MKILHLSNSGKQGGAARATFRINQALNGLGHESTMLVQNKRRDDIHVKSISKTKVQKALAKIRPIYDRLPLELYKDREEGPFSVARVGVNVSKDPLVRTADIVNLHWINGGFLSLKSIARLGHLNKPIVWTLHDMWPFTGGCHYSGDCDRFKENCGRCPILKSSKTNDLSRRVWKRKKKAYEGLNLTIVTPSRWLARCAGRSSLLSDVSTVVIPNCLDTTIFKPIDQGLAKEILNLPKDKSLILFGAMSATSDKRKGFRYLLEALEGLTHTASAFQDSVELVVFGASRFADIDNLPLTAHFLGRLSDDYTLALCYSAADVFVGSSLEEAFGQTLSEAMACGVPVVAFDYSGPTDIVDHEENGYLAEYRSARDLANGISWVLGSEERRSVLGERARQKVLENYSLEVVGRKYVSLYGRLLR